MKTIGKVILFGLLLSARVAVAEDVQPHLFDDLNGNGIVDAEENQASSAGSDDGNVEDIRLPDTPEDTGDNGDSGSQ